MDPLMKLKPGLSIVPVPTQSFVLVPMQPNPLAPLEGIHVAQSIPDTFEEIQNVESVNKLTIVKIEEPCCVAAPEEPSGPFLDCNYCKTRIYGTEFELKKHKKDHVNVNVRERPYKCLLCPNSYYQRGHLDGHIIRAHTERAYECDVCHRVYKHNCDLQNHKKTHVNVRGYPCSICGASFKVRSVLYSHRFVHVSDQVYTCSICGATFPRPDTCARHEKLHTSAKCFQCSHCPKRFFTGSALREHEVVHSDEKKFICVICGSGYKRAGRLKSHVKISHGNVDNKIPEDFQAEQSYQIPSLPFQPNTTSTTEEEEVDPLAGLGPAPENDSISESWDSDIVSEDAEGVDNGVSAANCEVNNSKNYFSILLPVFGIPHSESESTTKCKFQCLSCALEFPSKNKLTVHKNQAHSRTTKSSVYECKICGVVFSRSDQFTKHMRKHTGDCEICEICGKELAHRRSLRRHVMARHGKTAWDGYQDKYEILGRDVPATEDTCASNNGSEDLKTS